jgi:hypothetical protein
MMVLDNKFDDFDALAKSARGWDLDFRQLDRGRFEAKLTHLVTPEALLAECGDPPPTPPQGQHDRARIGGVGNGISCSCPPTWGR